jgi:predicted RNA-binding protein with PIN domain
MQKRIIIIDGYNVIHRVSRWVQHLDASLEQGREVLLSYCRRWMQTRGDVWLFYVVFDGNSGVTASHSSSGPGIRVVYSHTGETADDRILDIVREFGEQCDYVVVSDDRYVSGNAKRMSSEIMSADAFASVLSAKSDGATHPRKQRGRGKRLSGDVDDASHDNTAGKISVHDAKIVTDSLRREWNV